MPSSFSLSLRYSSFLSRLLTIFPFSSSFLTYMDNALQYFILLLHIDSLPIDKLILACSGITEGIPLIGWKHIRNQHLAQQQVPIHGILHYARNLRVFELDECISSGAGSLLGSCYLHCQYLPILSEIALELLLVEPVREMPDVDNRILLYIYMHYCWPWFFVSGLRLCEILKPVGFGIFVGFGLFVLVRYLLHHCWISMNINIIKIESIEISW